MAALVIGTNVVKQWSAGSADISALYYYKGANSGDTVILSADFLTVLEAVVIDFRAQLQGPCGITNGNQVALPGGISNGMGLLLVWGE